MSENSLTYEEAKQILQQRRKYIEKEISLFLKNQGFIKSKSIEISPYKLFDENIPLYIKIHHESEFTDISITSSDNLYITSSFSYGSDAYHPCVVSHDLFSPSYYILPELEQYKSLKIETNLLSDSIENIAQKFIDRLDFLIPKFIQASKNQFSHPISEKRKSHGLKAVEEYCREKEVIHSLSLDKFFKYILDRFGANFEQHSVDKINKILLNLPLNMEWYERHFSHPGYLPSYASNAKEKFFKKLETSEIDYFKTCFFLHSFLSRIQDDEELNILFGIEQENRPIGSRLSIDLYVYSLYMTHIFKAFEKDGVK